MRQNLPEDEMEYRKYIWRLKRRQERRRRVMIARAVAAAILLLFIVLLTLIIRFCFRAVTGAEQKGSDKKVEATLLPTSTVPAYSVPEGYEKISEQLEALLPDYPKVENILLNLYAYPEDILNLVINNQETLDFVLDYPRHKLDEEASGGLTQEEVSQGIPALYQWDERWGYVTYGSNILAIDGCGPTCLSMVCAGLLQDTSKTPDAMADFSIENNYYNSESGSSWSLMTTGAQAQGLKVHSISISEKDIRKQLKKGRPVICSMSPGDFTTTGHFIVLTGLTEDGKLFVNDPNSQARSGQEWEMDTVISQIKALWAYSVP